MSKISENQQSYIESLIAQRGYAEPVDFTSMTSSDASAFIDQLKRMPRNVGIEVGMYKTTDGEIYRVQESGTGNLYAKHLDVLAREFEYAPGAMRNLTASDRMTLEEAKAFGVQFGFCCVCARMLTDQKSLDLGIGPVCIRKV